MTATDCSTLGAGWCITLRFGCSINDRPAKSD